MFKMEVRDNIREVRITEDVDGSLFYGVEKYERCFITCEKYEEGKYRVSCQDDFTVGNSYPMHDRKTLAKTISSALRDGGKVWEFSSFKDLMIWVLDMEPEDE